MSQDPHPIDIHVGRRLRMRRMELGLSQDTLAEGLELTFQQVQKYERGANRISASKLFMTARILQVSVGYFFGDLDDPASPSDDTYAHRWSIVLEEMMAEPNGRRLVEAFLSIRRRSLRRGLADLASAIADSDQPTAQAAQPAGRAAAE